MPELPEVQTTVNALKARILGLRITEVWTDWDKMIKSPSSFSEFRRKILGRKILDIRRRAKYIIFFLEGGFLLVIHQKLSGHLLLGKWERKAGRWESLLGGAYNDRVNSYIHFLAKLSNGEMLAFSDLRKFGKILLLNEKEFQKLPEIQKLGLEPLAKEFSLRRFREILRNQRRTIKQVLMDQNLIAGIGNIYSNEALWLAKIHPSKRAALLSEAEIKSLYKAVRDVLSKALKLKGDSVVDYRLINGRKGGFQEVQNVYRKTGEPCPRCGTPIKRIKINGRSSFFCPKCQKL